MKIKIRAEGNSDIGYGHLQRTYAIAEYILNHSDHEVSYYTKDSGAEFFINKPVRHIEIEKEQEFVCAISSDEVVIVDGYEWDTSFLKNIKDKCYKLVIIDDLDDKELTADIIINHSPDSTIDYSKSDVQECLLGPKYALLSKPFINKYSDHSRVKDSILLCFGGSDPLNLTEKYWSIAADCFSKVNLVTGPGYRYKNGLVNGLTKRSNVSHEHDVSSARMAEIMECCQYALLPASGILFEALSRGLIIYSGYFINNQRRIYDGFKREKLIIGLGDFEEIEPLYLKDQFNKREVSQKRIVSRDILKSIFDGNSMQRIYNEIMK
ncbi:MAG: hypothetical protein AAFN93_02390 [Bacteroidota bacterium]